MVVLSVLASLVTVTVVAAARPGCGAPYVAVPGGCTPPYVAVAASVAATCLTVMSAASALAWRSWRGRGVGMLACGVLPAVQWVVALVIAAGLPQPL
jgi:hypothetical protein